MKNILTILLILMLPVTVYAILNKNSNDTIAFAQNKNLPSLMTFTSTMCIDCQKMKGIIKEIEGSYSDKINFVSVDATSKDKNVQKNIKKHNITLVPTMVFIDENGNAYNKIEGYIEKDELIKEIEDMLNG